MTDCSLRINGCWLKVQPELAHGIVAALDAAWYDNRLMEEGKSWALQLSMSVFSH